MAELDIGTLVGRVTIEDEVAAKLSEIGAHVKQFVSELEGSMGVAAGAVVVLTTAVAALTGSIVALGNKGSTILGVEDAFDHLAKSVGTTGEALSGALSVGVKSTIDDFDLMRSTSKLLGSGMKLTTDQAELMGKAARELGKATGTDAAGGLEIMSSALVTGRVRGLQQQIGLIDLKKGEEEFAKSLHVTVDQLTEEGKLEGKRIAILNATKAYVDRLGESQLSFKERLQQGNVAVDEWFDSLAKGVASSPHVLDALDKIGNAIKDTFGSDSKKLIDQITTAINGFADAIGAVAPLVIKAAGLIKTGLGTVLDTIVTQAVTFGAMLTRVFQTAVKSAVATLSAISGAAAILSAGPFGNLAAPLAALAQTAMGPLQNASTSMDNFWKSVLEMKNQLGDVKLAHDNAAAATDRNRFVTDKATEAQKKFAEALKDVLSFGQSWQDRLNGLSDDVVQGSRYYLEHGASVEKLAEMYGVAKADIEAVQKQMKFEESALVATTKALGDHTGYIASAVVPTYSQWHEELTGVDDVTGDLASTALTTGTAILNFADVVGDAEKETKSWRDRLEELKHSLGDELLKDLQDIPMMLEHAFTGGGGILGGVEAIGTKIGGTIGKSIGKAIGGISKLGGPIGEAVGSLVGPLIDFIANIGGPSKEELAARDAYKTAAAQAGGFQKVVAAYIEAGKTGADAARDWQRALDATHQSADAVTAVFEEINGVLDQHKQDVADTDAAIKEFGFTIEELGPKMQKQRLDEQAASLIRKWTLLVESGIRVETVNDRMASSIQDFLTNARITGQEVPKAMEPIIQKLIDQGDLTDEAGNKITDMKQLGISFAESMTAGFDKIVARLDKLLEGLGLIPKILDDIPKDVDFTVTGHYVPPDIQGGGGFLPGDVFDPGVSFAAMGGRVTASGITYFGGGGSVLSPMFSPRGTDTVPAMLTPGETVESVSDTQSNAANIKALAEAQAQNNASLKNIEKLLKDNPRATGVAVADAVLTMPRRSA